MDDNKLENGVSNLAFPPGDALTQELSLQTVLHIALRYKWTILVSTILSLAVAFLFLLKATPIYTSSSRVYVEQSGPKIISEYEGVMTQSGNYLYTQGELIKSTPIVADVVNDSRIKQFRTFADVDNLAAYIKNNLNVSIGRKDDIIAVSFDSPYPVEAAEIVNAVVQSYINYHSTRKRSTVSEVLRILQKEKVKRDEELSDKFAELLEFARENSEVSLDNQGGNIFFTRLTKLSTAVTDAQLSALNAKADYEAVKSMEDEPAKIKQFASASSTAGVRIFVNDTETQLKAELRAVEIELQNARYHCREDHPVTQAIHAKIDRIKQELESQAREFADSYAEVMQLRWTTAMERENELQASFDAQFQASCDLGIKATEYSVLQSELRRTERLCEILDDRIKELNVTEDVGALNINILEIARPAGSPSKPEKRKFMAMALALGLMLGGGLTMLREMFDGRLRSADEMSAVLGIPILGVIPTMSDRKAVVLSGHKVRGLLKLIVAGVHQRTGATTSSGTAQSEFLPAQDDGKAIIEDKSIMERAREVRSELGYIRCIHSTSKKTHGAVCTITSPTEARIKTKTTVVGLPIAGKSKITSETPDAVKRGQKVHLEPKSIVAEAYRTIRTAVFFGISREEAKTIVVTSPSPGDGKSTVVSNLAIAMAQAGQRTLVVDADLRKPMQHNIFQIDSREEGLSNLLAGTINIEEAIRPGPVDGLDIINCGIEVPNPSEVLNSDSFAKALKVFSGRYDRVIIDSPPVGPVADSQILAALCDVTLLVLRAERSTRRHSQQARDSLLSVGGHILGAIVNDVAPKHSRYGYHYAGRYGGYGSYSHYGYYGNREKKKALAG
ncbi:MAG: polysaccharide biosynthesis tyrosine autokinase [Phycisphaerae bacterium]|nr:polysaccharide biosynthesis tyrosine autokinase [Phycisphaerae bacterium]